MKNVLEADRRQQLQQLYSLKAKAGRCQQLLYYYVFHLLALESPERYDPKFAVLAT